MDNKKPSTNNLVVWLLGLALIMGAAGLVWPMITKVSPEAAASPPTKPAHKDKQPLTVDADWAKVCTGNDSVRIADDQCPDTKDKRWRYSKLSDYSIDAPAVGEKVSKDFQAERPTSGRASTVPPEGAFMLGRSPQDRSGNGTQIETIEITGENVYGADGSHMKMVKLHLPDGRYLPCVVWGGYRWSGLHCDWDAATTPGATPSTSPSPSGPPSPTPSR